MLWCSPDFRFRGTLCIGELVEFFSDVVYALLVTRSTCFLELLVFLFGSELCKIFDEVSAPNIVFCLFHSSESVSSFSTIAASLFLCCLNLM